VPLSGYLDLSSAACVPLQTSHGWPQLMILILRLRDLTAWWTAAKGDVWWQAEFQRLTSPRAWEVNHWIPGLFFAVKNAGCGQTDIMYHHINISDAWIYKPPCRLLLAKQAMVDQMLKDVKG
jgi:hypothetical protein